ncbi:unnamed protein product [Nesidiocoris tenuis]|uniref:Uncharacterized protein n=1 Tax=Nesidiocoris tenuis TaxID=355587 RepID=A0A6H5HP68_9HEMI|nr:unnamed protein product [Nesidiocoris tenuis]
MLTVAKAPIKIVTKTRRGISQNIENLRDSKKPQEENGDLASNDPKPYFQPTNGKKANSLRAQQEAISPQHEELIKFIYDNFTPFDLESWWGKRLFNTITKSVP